MLKRILTYSGIILLNFTGLGLGFLALGRWNRWRAHLMLTLGLFLLAIMMRAYQSPLAWTVVASAWVLVTALEACLLVQSSNWKPAGWLVFLLGVAACGLTAAAAVSFEQSAVGAYSAGLRAYGIGDCQTALEQFKTFAGVYRFSLSPLGDGAAARSAQCRQYQYAVQAGENGFEAQALDTLAQLASPAPEALPLDVIRKQVVQIRQEAALRLAAQGSYEQGVQMLLAANQVELTGSQLSDLREQAAKMVIAWGDQVGQGGNAEQAISIYQQVLNSYGDTGQTGLAQQRILNTYQALAEARFRKGDLEGALSIYSVLKEQYPDRPEARPPAGRMMALYSGLASASAERQDYAGMAMYNEALLGLGDAAVPAPQIHLKLADIYLARAADLRKQGHFEQALEIYQKLVSDYADTPAAAQASAQIPFARLAWVDDLYTNNQFDLALQKLAQMQFDYPNLPFSTHVAEKYPELYLAWGQNLFSQAKFQDAIQKYEMARIYSSDAKVLARVQSGIKQAQDALSN